MYRIEPGLPTVVEYRALRAAVGWESPPEARCRIALESSAFGVTARVDGRAVGMARLVGDEAMYLFVVDVAVDPQHQGRGLGRRLANAALQWARESATRSVLLIASPQVAPFYRSLGLVGEDDTVMSLLPETATERPTPR